MIWRVYLAGQMLELLDLEAGQIYNGLPEVRDMLLLTFWIYLFKGFLMKHLSHLMVLRHIIVHKQMHAWQPVHSNLR